MTDEKEVLKLKKEAKEKKIADRLSGFDMRELNGEDIFKVLDIAERLNLADTVLEFMAKKDEAELQQQKVAGYATIAADSKDNNKVVEMQSKITDIQKEVSANSLDIIGKIVKLVLSNLDKIKPELNGLLGDLTDKTADEISKTNIVTYTLLIKAFFSKPELKELSELLF